jgi:hypothetical protein
MNSYYSLQRNKTKKNQGSTMQNPKTTTDNSSSATLDGVLWSILEEQYQCTEEYCNATTSLHNALVKRQTITVDNNNNNSNANGSSTSMQTNSSQSPMLEATTRRSFEALCRVQNCTASLEQVLAGLGKNQEQQHRPTPDDDDSKNRRNGDPAAVAPISSHRDKAAAILLPRLREHRDRSKRILSTIYALSGEGTSFHASNGLPTTPSTDDGHGVGGSSGSDSNTNVKLVALVTLRASIKSVQQVLIPPTTDQ